MTFCEFNNHSEFYHLFLENGDHLLHLGASCNCGKVIRRGTSINPHTAFWNNLIGLSATKLFLCSFHGYFLKKYFILDVNLQRV